MSQKGKTTPKPSPKNTLFKYFAKTTPTNTSPAPEPAEKVEKIQTKPEGKKLDFSKRDAQDDSDDETFAKPSKKRRLIDSDEEDSENTDNNKMQVDTTPKPVSKRSIAKDDSPAVTPKVAKKAPRAEKADLDGSFVEEKESLMLVDNLNKVWPHEKLPFLQPDKIMDNKRRRPDHPEYDARTLYVPPEHIKQQTPAMAQWWTLKSNHYDCIFFFKVGKFYELYHSDAVVGVKELGFTYMGKDEHAHSGFPEKAYEKMASQLVEKGYKVARVEQTENPEMMKERCDRENTKDKFSKVMKREICQITDRGTQIFSSGLQKMTAASDPNFMLAIAEIKLTATSSRYGVCFGDTSIGEFWVGAFDDDQQCSRLLTLLSHYSPVLVLHDRIPKTQHTEKIIKSLNALKEPLTNDKQMWSAEKTLEFLASNKFGDGEPWPETLAVMKDESLKPVDEHMLALKALGGCLWYLQNNLLVTQVLSIATFKLYVPPDQAATDRKVDKKYKPKSMVLDNITLSNLNVIGKENSLVQKLDYCTTQSGKRLLLEYLCAPSCEVDEIRGRQEAVKQLYDNNGLLQSCRGLLSSLNVDLERSLAQIRQFGIRDQMGDHPDSRAILYETATYGKNKIADFAAVLNAFDLLMGLPEMFAESTTPVLKTLTQTKENGGCFIDCSSILEKFKNAFDIKEALKTGFAVPERNADDEYDKVLDDIDALEKELKVYLKEQGKHFGCTLKYFGSDRKRYQIEVPEAMAKKVPQEYSLESCAGKGKNAVKRFTTDETKDFLSRMQKLEESKKEVMNDFAGRVYSKFSKHYNKFKTISGLVAKLDVLAGLAEYARNQNAVCMPEIHDIRENDGESLLKIENGVHPLMNSDDFIPNGMNIPSSGKAFFELITGPNMGGKSTLMREVALLSIMAQVGSFVPAESMELSIIDRIFTRLGANDNIMANQSTFLVELNETSLILKHCTHNSLVLLDELGRGTSTYDGTAIAQSVASFLADLQCRTLFSTHYHSLVDNFFGDERIHLGHMACMVENENSEDITKENVTFLYKYVTGSCPKSFGFNAAKLAGIQLEIIRRAHEIAKRNEADSLKRRITAKILNHSSPAEIKNLLIKFQKCFI